MKNMQKRAQNDSQFPRAGPAVGRELVGRQQVTHDPGVTRGKGQKRRDRSE